MEKYVVHNFWPTPVYQSNLNVKPKWFSFCKKTKYTRMLSKNADISKNKYILDKIIDLKKEILIHSNIYFKKYLKIKNNVNFYLLNSWIVNHRPGDSSATHCHKNSMFSGVYYIKVPDNSGDLVFDKGFFNNIGVSPSTFHFEFEENNLTTAESIKISPKEGTIVLFPSHLKHAVTLNNSKNDRISLAFNFYAKGKIGEEECELTIG